MWRSHDNHTSAYKMITHQKVRFSFICKEQCPVYFHWRVDLNRCTLGSQKCNFIVNAKAKPLKRIHFLNLPMLVQTRPEISCLRYGKLQIDKRPDLEERGFVMGRARVHVQRNIRDEARLVPRCKGSFLCSASSFLLCALYFLCSLGSMLQNISSVFLDYTHLSEMKGLVTCHSILLDRRKPKKKELQI